MRLKREGRGEKRGQGKQHKGVQEEGKGEERRREERVSLGKFQLHAHACTRVWDLQTA